MYVPPKDPSFSFCIPAINLPFPTTILEILESLSKLNMGSVSSLLLLLEHDDAVWTTGINPRVALHAFLSQFSGLKTLSPTPQVLRLILKSIIDDPRILPSLRNVHFQFQFPNIQDLDALLSHRREIGLPLELLVFPEMVQMENEKEDYRHLENYQGLKVAWEPCPEDDEYVCGSGAPEVLLFRKKIWM
ncbi:hypothetical protein CPC08DRAFT_766621 [Agrocybe pediades]|nr:hypothetical protein CPC08DRAFT_766621 [Agrocybe pediades]